MRRGAAPTTREPPNRDPHATRPLPCCSQERCAAAPGETQRKGPDKPLSQLDMPGDKRDGWEGEEMTGDRGLAWTRQGPC